MTQPIYEKREITDFKDLINQSVSIYGNKNAFSIKGIILSVCDTRPAFEIIVLGSGSGSEEISQIFKTLLSKYILYIKQDLLSLYKDTL